MTDLESNPYAQPKPLGEDEPLAKGKILLRTGLLCLAFATAGSLFLLASSWYVSLTRTVISGETRAMFRLLQYSTSFIQLVAIAQLWWSQRRLLSIVRAIAANLTLLLAVCLSGIRFGLMGSNGTGFIVESLFLILLGYWLSQIAMSNLARRLAICVMGLQLLQLVASLERTVPFLPTSVVVVVAQMLAQAILCCVAVQIFRQAGNHSRLVDSAS